MIENVKCPQCGGPMASRANRSTGQRFWGCKKYPECRGTLNTDGEAPRRRDDDDDGESQSPSERFRTNDRGRWRNQ